MWVGHGGLGGGWEWVDAWVGQAFSNRLCGSIGAGMRLRANRRHVQEARGLPCCRALPPGASGAWAGGLAAWQEGRPRHRQAMVSIAQFRLGWRCVCGSLAHASSPTLSLQMHAAPPHAVNKQQPHCCTATAKLTSTSRPDSAAGSACAWMAVGRSYPARATACSGAAGPGAARSIYSTSMLSK